MELCTKAPSSDSCNNATVRVQAFEWDADRL